jgi:hypothetical protein
MVLNVLEPNGTAVITLAPARPTSNAQFRAFKAAARVRIPLGTQDLTGSYTTSRSCLVKRLTL